MISQKLKDELKEFSDSSISLIEAISYFREANEEECVKELSDFIEEHGSSGKTIQDLLGIFDNNLPPFLQGMSQGIPPFLQQGMQILMGSPNFSKDFIKQLMSGMDGVCGAYIKAMKKEEKKD